MVVPHSQPSLKNLASEFASLGVTILEIMFFPFFFCFLERKEETEETKK